MGAAFSQIYPPRATFTEFNLPSQQGKTFVVTGGYSSVGLELVRILYDAGGHIYIAGRNQASAEKAIQDVISHSTASKPGALEYLPLDLSDLSTIKASADRLLKKGVAIDVLWNNAGRGNPPEPEFSAQGFENQVATNVLGAFLFTRLIEPCLTTNHLDNSRGTTRIVWAASQVVDMLVPEGGRFVEQVSKTVEEQQKNLDLCYAWSKLGNWYLASEFGRRLDENNDSKPGRRSVLSVADNPGGLRTGITRDRPWWFHWLVWPVLHHARQGAYTTLFAGFSEELTVMEHQGAYVVPWGRLHPNPREDLLVALRSEEGGGTREAGRAWEWCEEMTKEYR